MEKGELLDRLKAKLESGEITPEEMRSLLEAQPHEPVRSGAALSSKLSALLYYIGGGIVFLGLVFLMAQEWNHFGPMMRVFITLGSGIAAFVVGVLFSRQERLGAAGPAFFLISAMLLPGGLFVAYDEAGLRAESLSSLTQISAIATFVFITGYLALRKNVLLVFGILFGTWFYFALTNWLVAGGPIFDRYEFVSYRILLAGLAYIFLGHAFADTQREVLTGWLYGLGVAGFLGAGFALGRWKPDQNAIWEAIYPGLVFAVIFLSTYLKSKTFLVFGSLALGVFLSKITAEYFSDSLGWPLSLVLMGFLLMGVAYAAVRIKRQYISA